MPITRDDAWLMLGAKPDLRAQANNRDKAASHRQLWALNAEGCIGPTAVGQQRLEAARARVEALAAEREPKRAIDSA